MKVCFKIALASVACFASAGQRSVDGEEALSRFQSLLRRGGVTGTLDVESLSQTRDVPYYAKTKLWQIGVKSGNETWSGNVDEHGRVRYVCASFLSGGPVPKLTQAQIDHKAWSMLQKLGDHPPVYLQTAQLDGPVIMATFKMSTNGLRLFNLNPLYGYIVKFTPSGKLTYLIDEAESLMPNAKSPKVTEAAARSMLEKHNDIVEAKHRSEKFVEMTHATWGMKAELGYYKLPGESKARLVWRGSLTQTISGHTHEQMEVPSLIDAVTGKSF